MDPRVLDELSTSRNQIRELEGTIKSQSSDEQKVSFSSSLAPINEVFKLELVVTEYNFEDGERKTVLETTNQVETTWMNIFLLATLTITGGRKY